MCEEETSNDAEKESEMKQIENEITLVESQICEVNEQIENTRMSCVISDDVVSCLIEENEKLAADLKSQMRINEDLVQRLEKEQEYYRKDIHQFHKDMSLANESNKNNRNSIKLKRTYSSTKLESGEVKALSKLRQENHELKGLLSSGTKMIFSICIKFQRMKKHKDFIQNKLLMLEDDLHNIAAYAEKLLKDNKQEIESASTQCFSEHIHRRDSLFVETSQRNHLLIQENLALKSECQKLQNSLQKNGSKKKKASESGDWLTRNSVSYYQDISSCQAFKALKEGNASNTESFCDAAILDVATAYVSRITPSMLNKKCARKGKVVRRKHQKDQRAVDDGHNIMRSWSSPVLADMPPTVL